MTEGLCDCSDSLEVISLPLCLYVYLYASMFAPMFIFASKSISMHLCLPLCLYVYAPMSDLSLVSPLTKVNTKIEPKSN